MHAKLATLCNKLVDQETLHFSTCLLLTVHDLM